tara:strand:- start:12124 stop:12672 length:549 start_codon:yes stop_codon:yes gene_type:complete
MERVKILLLIIIMSLFGTSGTANYNKLAYDFTFKGIDGNDLDLSQYKGKILIVINVASQCGFTNQYQDMQKIWEAYQEQGVIVLGVPTNDFNQEPENNNNIKKFCETNFGITFPMTEKVSVKGENAHPFYKWALKNHGKSTIPKWNFHKIIINKNGKVEDTFASITNPSSKRFIKAIEKALN